MARVQRTHLMLCACLMAVFVLIYFKPQWEFTERYPMFSALKEHVLAIKPALASPGLAGDVLTRTNTISRNKNSMVPVEPMAPMVDSRIASIESLSADANALIFNKSTIRYLKPVKIKQNEVLLFSAIAGNSTDDATWDTLAITGWESRGLRERNQTYMCCVVSVSGVAKLYPVVRTLVRPGQCEMVARQFICGLNEVSLVDRPVSATLTDTENPTCGQDVTDHVEIEYTYRHPQDIAVFAKVLFGAVPARELVVWFEIHRLMGVRKVIVYPYELHGPAMKVLQYYQNQGLLDVISYNRPGPEHGVAYEAFSVTSTQHHNDQQVPEYEGLERLRGYKYIVSFDVDEFIIPQKEEETWMTVFDRVFNEKEDAAAFMFPVYIHVTSWDPTGPASPYKVAQYLNRSRETRDRPKMVSIPTRPQMKSEDAAIHHYRACRGEWLSPRTSFPCYNITRYHDETVLKQFRKVEMEINDVVTKLRI